MKIKTDKKKRQIQHKMRIATKIYIKVETKKAINYVVKNANSSVKCIPVFRDFFLGGSNHLGENKTSFLHLLKKHFFVDLLFILIFGILNDVIWEDCQILVLGVLYCIMECDTSLIISKG